jgi:hypothetical protein
MPRAEIEVGVVVAAQPLAPTFDGDARRRRGTFKFRNVVRVRTRWDTGREAYGCD